MFLADVAPEIATELDADNHVVIISRPGCGPCIFTYRSILGGGLPVKKHIVSDSKDPIIVGVKAHLNVHPDATIPMPAVFVKGKFEWNGMDQDAIKNTIQSFGVAA
jgi:hypothetical protein